MDQATQILVVINSVVLVIFLLLAIYLLVQIASTVRNLRKLIARAESAAEAIETFRSAAVPFKLGQYFANFANSMNKKGKKRG